jgi:glutamyl-Q tRNA(Asp) synthetase
LYRGRFAPSPTGPLHFGSLVAAVGSYLQAKVSQGQWLVRIEDVDAQRAVPGAADAILRTLEMCGFEWDAEVIYQSVRGSRYEQALAWLAERGLTYHCSCSRAEIETQAPRSLVEDGELRYPGLCRNGPLYPQRPMAVRFRVPERPITFTDALQGTITLELAGAIGDFVLKRRDGLFAYQIAVVVDDYEQGVTHVVRGADLLYNTPRQMALQYALGFETPVYVHLPIATDAGGRKLSKATAATAVDLNRPALVLWRVLAFLNQSPPPELIHGSVADVWAWAKSHWNIGSVARIQAKPAQASDQT